MIHTAERVGRVLRMGLIGMAGVACHAIRASPGCRDRQRRGLGGYRPSDTVCHRCPPDSGWAGLAPVTNLALGGSGLR